MPLMLLGISQEGRGEGRKECEEVSDMRRRTEKKTCDESKEGKKKIVMNLLAT